MSELWSGRMIAVIDTETTGLGETDVVIEFAAVPEWHSFLVSPGLTPIQPEARAAHHITDDDLASAHTAEEWAPVVERILTQNLPVSHNAEFDLRMIRQTWPGIAVPERYICTWRCALHLWPEAPSHSNQVLRYWLNLDVTLPPGLPPHRALPDALVTEALLKRMMAQLNLQAPLQHLVELTQTPVVLHRCRFGAHRDKLWVDVPPDYLRWILRQPDFDHDVVHTARTLLGVPP